MICVSIATAEWCDTTWDLLVFWGVVLSQSSSLSGHDFKVVLCPPPFFFGFFLAFSFTPHFDLHTTTYLDMISLFAISYIILLLLCQ